MPRGDWDVASPSLTLPPGAGPGDSRLFLGPDVPLILQTFYSVYGTSYACILAYSDANNYQYTLWLKTATGGMSAYAQGWVLAAATVVEHTFTYFPPPGTGLPFNTLIGPVLNIPGAGYQYNFRGTAAASLSKTDPLYSSLNIAPEMDFCIGTHSGIPISAMRGFLGASTTSGYAGINSGGLEVVIASASYAHEHVWTFQDSRIFMYMLWGFAFNLSAAAMSVDIVRIRKGQATTAGTILDAEAWGIDSTAGAGPILNFQQFGYFENSSGADVTTTLSITHQRSAGAAVTNISNLTGPGVGILAVYDVGSIDDWPDTSNVLASV